MRLRHRTVIVLCLASLAFRLRFVAHDILDLATHEPFYDDSFDSFGFARYTQDAAHDVCFEPLAGASVLGVPGWRAFGGVHDAPVVKVRPAPHTEPDIGAGGGGAGR